MDEIYCNDYNWELFFRISSIIVPKILKRAHTRRRKEFRFCVIGGKAVDAHTSTPAYSENYIGSPDWDIDTTDKVKFEKFVKDSIEAEIPSLKLSSTKVDKDGAKGVQLGIVSGKCILRFMDIFQVPEIESELIDGIPYIPRKQLMIQLFKILSDRRAQYTQGLELIPRDEDIAQRIADATKSIKDAKDKLMRAVRKCTKDENLIEKIEEYVNDIEDYTDIKKGLLDAADSKEKLEIDLKVEKSMQKLEKTRQRLKTLAVQNKGYVAEVCNECSKDISKTIDSVSCELIKRECTNLDLKA